MVFIESSMDITLVLRWSIPSRHIIYLVLLKSALGKRKQPTVEDLDDNLDLDHNDLSSGEDFSESESDYYYSVPDSLV